MSKFRYNTHKLKRFCNRFFLLMSHEYFIGLLKCWTPLQRCLSTYTYNGMLYYLSTLNLPSNFWKSLKVLLFFLKRTQQSRPRILLSCKSPLLKHVQGISKSNPSIRLCLKYFLCESWKYFHFEFTYYVWTYSKLNHFFKIGQGSQLAHNVRTTLYGRWNDVLTMLYWRRVPAEIFLLRRLLFLHFTW